MKTTLTILFAVTLGIIPVSAEPAPQSSQTVGQLYPNLASGILTYANIGALPEGVLLKAEGIEIRSDDIEKTIAAQPPQMQAGLKKNAFFVLEQEATGKLLKAMALRTVAQAETEAAAMSDQELLQGYFKELTKDVKVTDQDVETFYKENESVFCGTPLASVRKQIESYVLQDKQQRFVDEHIRTLGRKVEIAVSEPWTRQQAVSAKDNPLDHARASGKPTLAIFSAASCCGPDKMIPVKEALLKQYDNKITIVYLEPRQEQVLAARYGIRSIPTQILYDKTGQEFFRHSGFISEKDIAGKLKEMGVQ